MSTLLVVIIGLIGVLLGYIIGKSGGFGNNSLANLITELDHKKLQLQELQAEIDELKSKKDSGSHILGFTSGEPVPVAFDPELASSVIGRKVEENDLKIIEGIGPKIEELFKTSGIIPSVTLALVQYNSDQVQVQSTMQVKLPIAFPGMDPSPIFKTTATEPNVSVQPGS